MSTAPIPAPASSSKRLDDIAAQLTLGEAALLAATMNRDQPEVSEAPTSAMLRGAKNPASRSAVMPGLPWTSSRASSTRAVGLVSDFTASSPIRKHNVRNEA